MQTKQITDDTKVTKSDVWYETHLVRPDLEDVNQYVVRQFTTLDKAKAYAKKAARNGLCELKEVKTILVYQPTVEVKEIRV